MGLVSAGQFVSPDIVADGRCATDLSGNLFLAVDFTGSFDADPGPNGAIQTSSGNFDTVVTKFSPDGRFAWARRIGGTEIDRPSSIQTDSSGNCYVLGSFGGVVDFDPGAGVSNLDAVNGAGFLLKLDASGALVWVKQFGTGASSLNTASMAIDASGTAVISGDFLGIGDFNPGPPVFSLDSSAAGSRSAFLLKLSASGDFVWAKAYGGANTTVTARSIAVGTDGSIVVGGVFNGGGQVDFDPSTTTSLRKISNGGFDAYVSKFHSSGALLWNNTFGGANSDRIDHVDVDSTGNVVVSGDFFSTIDFAPGSAVHLVTPLSHDSFILGLTSSGQFRWFDHLRQTSAGGGAFVASMTVDSSDNILVSVSGFNAEIAWGGQTREVNDSNVSKLDKSGALMSLTYTGIAFASLALTPGDNLFGAGSLGPAVDVDPGYGETILSAQAPGFSNTAFVQLSQELRVSAVAAGTNSFLVRKRGEDVEIIDKNSGIVLQSGPINEVLGIEITGTPIQKDFLTVDFGGGTFSLPNGIRFNGDTGTGSLAVIGAGSESAIFRSGSFSGLTELQINGGVIQATGIESVEISSMTAVRVETQGITDVVSVVPTLLSGATVNAIISGTSSGQTIVPLTIQGVDRVVIDTGANDILPASSNDSVAISASALSAPGLSEFVVTTGAGNDTVNVAGPDFSVAGETGSFQVQGGTGLDRLNVSGNVDWNLIPGQIINSIGSHAGFSSIETVGITGGASANTIDASTFTGKTILDGSGGNDTLRGGFGDDILFGGTGNDRLYGNAGADVLYGQDNNDFLYAGDGDDTLWGGGGNDRLHAGEGDDYLSGDTGNDTLLGEDGNDSLIGGIGNDYLTGGNDDDTLNGSEGDDWLYGDNGDDSLLGGTGRDRLDGGNGNDALTGGVAGTLDVDVYIFNGTAAADEMRLARTSATGATYTRKPRGLVSIFEQDTIVNDGQDEFQLNALEGNDLIAIDLAFTLLGTIDGGDGSDTCTAPQTPAQSVNWLKVNCES